MDRRSSKRGLALAAVVGLGVVMAACGGSSDNSTSSSAATTAPAASGGTAAAPATSGGGSIDGKGELIVVLMPSTTNNYLAEWVKGAKEEAARTNFKLKIIENNFDQSEQDVQVQQELASGDKPIAYVYWPADGKAGVASLRQLFQTGIPVVQTNQRPPKDAEPYFTMYAGVNDVLNGQVSGQLMTAARDQLVANGGKLHSANGNLLEVKFVAGYTASDDRTAGFVDATKDKPFDIIASENAGFDNDAGFKTTSQLIAANKSKGIDFLFAHNDALAAGAIQALEEAGLKPGQDVMVVGGTCHGDLSALEEGKQFGTGLQAAALEGTYSINSVGRYLSNGNKVQDGEFTGPDDPDAAPAETGAPYKYNFIPNPAVKLGGTPDENKATIDGTKLWGKTMRDYCTY
jgi:ribose transport system substrate-binding protein